MLLNEFIERTGFTPTEECFNLHIHPSYMKSQLEKDEWCKLWKKSDGLALAYQWQVDFDKAQIASQKAEIQEFSKTQAVFAEEQTEMTVFLIEQAEKWAATDLREKAIEIMGAKEYITYKIEHGMNLWQLDKELIIELLNQ